VKLTVHVRSATAWQAIIFAFYSLGSSAGTTTVWAVVPQAVADLIAKAANSVAFAALVAIVSAASPGCTIGPDPRSGDPWRKQVAQFEIRRGAMPPAPLKAPMQCQKFMPN
jgi:hypothetical protein